jgi:hypothetical protein
VHILSIFWHHLQTCQHFSVFITGFSLITVALLKIYLYLKTLYIHEILFPISKHTYEEDPKLIVLFIRLTNVFSVFFA